MMHARVSWGRYSLPDLLATIWMAFCLLEFSALHTCLFIPSMIVEALNVSSRFKAQRKPATSLPAIVVSRKYMDFLCSLASSRSTFVTAGTLYHCLCMTKNAQGCNFPVGLPPQKKAPTSPLPIVVSPGICLSCL